MTHRETEASGRVTAARPAVAPAPLPPAAPVAPEPPRIPPWETLYRSVPAAQQSELLRLARRQGVLYSHQLPAPGTPVLPDRARQLLAQLDALTELDLEPVRGECPPLVDEALDPVQREAVARALATPDLCLVQGPPATGKSRVVAEIVTQAASRGERVLLLAPTTAALDHVLERVRDREVVCAVRCLDRDERPEALPARIRALTFTEQVRRLSSQAIEGARLAARSGEERLDRLRQHATLWGRLEESAAAQQDLARQRQALVGQRDQVAGDVAREAERAEAGEPTAMPAFAEALCSRRDLFRAACSEAEAKSADTRQRQQQRQKELAEIEADLAELRPLMDAKTAGRWWTGPWWQATLRGDLAPRWRELHERLEQAQRDLAALEQQLRDLDAGRDEARRAYEADRAGLLEAEAQRRRGLLDERDAALCQEEALLLQKWQALCQQLDPDLPRPVSPTVEAIAGTRRAWEERLRDEEDRAVFARQWTTYLEHEAGTLAARLPAYVNLVAATLTAFPADAQFGDASANGVTNPAHFDLLILEDAHLLTDADFLRVARRARRWVLVGEPGGELGSRPVEAARPVRRPESGRPAPVRPTLTASRPGLFQRLWQRLHCDPRQHPAEWRQEGGRLHCRLRPVAPDETRWLESERVADFPEVELRILSLPRTPPVLAEVIFPPTMTIAQAKEYIFRELGELPVRATGPCLGWEEDPERIVLRLADRPAPNAVPVALETGVREMVGIFTPEVNGDASTAPAWQTCRVEFDRAAGWTRDRAEAWCEQYLHLRDLGRTIRLDVAHRLPPSLTALLGDWLTVRAPELHAHPAHARSALEFVAVPGHAPGRRDRAAAAARRGGAGLEIDLADPRQRERLPAELRASLPGRGIVNYAEAQAVVEVLGGLLRDPSLRANHAEPGAAPAIAVLALYAAQVELLRLLLRQQGLAEGAAAHLEVGLPAAWRHREARVVLLSLTRSHTHRAVPFGDGPHQLALALTRATHRVLLFGDPGTLARRAQWEGALDHLDEPAAVRERELIDRLVRYHQGHGGDPGPARLHEGSGA